MVLTANEAAKRLRVSKPTICALCRKGQMKARKVGKQWRIPEGEVSRYEQMELE